MTRHCPNCKTDLPIELFGKSTRRHDGVSCWCKECNRKSVSRYRSTPEGKEKHRAQEDLRHKNNRDRFIAKAKAYYAKNRERAKERNLERGRRLYAESLEHREKQKLRGQLWARNNRARSNARARNGRLRRIRATPQWLTAIQKAQIQEFYDIAAARAMQTGEKHHVDHIFAIKGQGWRGLHVPWNLQVLTASENDRKWIKVPKNFEHLLWNPQKNLRSHV